GNRVEGQLGAARVEHAAALAVGLHVHTLAPHCEEQPSEQDRDHHGDDPHPPQGVYRHGLDHERRRDHGQENPPPHRHPESFRVYRERGAVGRRAEVLFGHTTRLSTSRARPGGRAATRWMTLTTGTTRRMYGGSGAWTAGCPCRCAPTRPTRESTCCRRWSWSCAPATARWSGRAWRSPSPRATSDWSTRGPGSPPAPGCRSSTRPAPWTPATAARSRST